MIQVSYTIMFIPICVIWPIVYKEFKTKISEKALG